MLQFNINQVKTQLSQIFLHVQAGKEITIAKAGTPIAKIIPFKENAIRVPGLYKGKIWIAEDFDDPLPNELLQYFEEADE